MTEGARERVSRETGLSSSQVDALIEYSALLLHRAVPAGFVARGDADSLLERHVLDSLRGLPCLPNGPALVMDLGSGAGLPGIPFAVARPDLLFVLVEPRPRRAGFLELAAERLRLENVRVVVSRAQDVRQRADACVARALADPLRTWQLGSSLLRSEGRLVYYAGRSWDVHEEAALMRVGVRCVICSPPRFPGQGPVVMMRSDA